MKKNNIFYNAGIDEAGRGPIFGPLSISIVILPNEFKDKRIIDSKKLNFQKREKLFELITKNAIYYKNIFISNKEIDNENINTLTRNAIIELYNEASKKYKIKNLYIDYIKVPEIECSHSESKAEDKYIEVAAASIISKVLRDRYILSLDPKYDKYGIKTNFGYLTRKHKEAIEKHEMSDLHRKKYRIK